MTSRESSNISVQGNGCTLKKSKNLNHRSEALIDINTCKLKTRPPIPTIKDTVQIQKKASIKPSIPTVKETVHLNNQVLKINDVNKRKVKNEFEEQKIAKKTKVNEKNAILEKKKFAEERKKRLDEFQKTLRDVAKTSVKKKIIHVSNECKIAHNNIPTKLNQTEVDQTWSPPPKVKSLKKISKTPIHLQNNVIKDLETLYNDDKNFNISRNIKTAFPKCSKNTNTTQAKLIEKKPLIRDVTKPEDLYKGNQSIYNNLIFNISTSNLVNTDTSFTQNDHNTVLLTEEICHNNEKLQVEDDMNGKISDLSLSTKFIDTLDIDHETYSDSKFPKKLNDDTVQNIVHETYSDSKLPKKLNEDIMQNIDHSVEFQELLINQCLSSKKSYSESTQTDGCISLLPLFSSKNPPPPMNFISILKCKYRLQEIENDDLKVSKTFANLSTNECTISNNLNNNKINSNKPDKANIEEALNNIIHFNYDKQKHCLIDHKSSLTDEVIKSDQYSLSLNHVTTEENICKKNLPTENIDMLFSKLNLTTNENDQVLKKFNCDIDCLTKNNCDNANSYNVCKSKDFKKCANNSINKTWPYFSEIHDGFKAELNLLEQLNDSLCDIEKMSSNTSIQNNEKINDHDPINDLNFETSFNDLFLNSDKPTQFSKINDLSSNMMSVDKTITNFSIQMFEQLIKDEELRAKQHHTILNLREKSLINRLTWEGTMNDLQVRNFKNQLGHEKQLQLLKQKQRGSVKKLVNSLSQIKRLRRVIDSIYKQRLIMLEEQLQHLKMQSSSKKVIRKLKSLDQIPKKEEYVYQPLNSSTFKQCGKTDFVRAVENEHGNMNYIEFNSASTKSTSPTLIEDNSNIVVQNQDTSSINIEKTNFKQVENVNVQTDHEWIPQPAINKSMQTSSTFCNHMNNKHLNSTNTTYRHEFSDVNKFKDETLLSPIYPRSLAKPREHLSETSNSTNSEQSDIDVRITELQEQLETRKSEFFKIKNEQKKLRSEYLKSKEQELLKQIELYDNKIEKSKKNLLAEVENKNIQLTKCSIKHDSSSNQSKSSSFEKVVNYDSTHASEKHSKHLPISDKITWTDGKQFFYPIATNLSSSNELKFLNPVHELPQQNNLSPKEHFSLYTNNNNSVKVDYNKLRKQLFQSLDTSQVCETVPLQNKSSILAVNNFEESQDNQSESQAVETPNHPLNHLGKNLKEEIVPFKMNDVHLNSKVPLCEYSIPLKEMSYTINNQELHLEKNTNTQNLTTSCNNVNNDSSTSSSTSCNIQRTPKENDNNLYKENEDNVSQLNLLNNETEDYSSDFTSDENTPELERFYEINKHNTIIESQVIEENESSYEEERSEGDIMFEDKTFIEQYSDFSDLVQNEKYADTEVDIITNNIFNGLLKDIKKILKLNTSKPLLSPLKKNELNNLTEETPLLMILKREKELENMIFLNEQATSISKALLKRHLQPILSEALLMLLPRLNEIEQEKLKVYLNWSSSKRKKLKLSEYFHSQHKINDVENDELFEMFYQKYQEPKSPSLHNESSDVMLSQTQQEAEKLKLEQIRIEEEIERLHMTEDVEIFLREIPNKPPPPYKSPTKIKSLVDMPYTSDEMFKIVLMATSQLFKDSQSSMSIDYIIDSDSNLHADYKTLIFDYCKEITQDTFISENNVPIWERSVKNLKQFRARPKNPKNLSDVVLKKMKQIIEIDECEEMVNKFVVKQMHEEDSKWTDFEMDEMFIQNDIVKSLMKKLVGDTITNIKTNFYLKFNL